MSDPVRAAWLEPLALPSVRGAWLRFGIVLLVAVLVATGVALSRKNQFDPIPTATLGSSGHVDVGGYRFTVVHPLRPIPTPHQLEIFDQRPHPDRLGLSGVDQPQILDGLPLDHLALLLIAPRAAFSSRSFFGSRRYLQLALTS